MDVEHEPADRHRRIAAIVDHFVPVFITKLGDIHPERGQNIERVARRHRTLRQRAAQLDGFGLAVAPAQQFGFEQIEIVELFARTERRVIGDIVGGPDEIVEAQDQRPVTRMNDPGRDREILVTVRLAGSQFARDGHQELATLVWVNGDSPLSAHAMAAKPHIREYDTKTNAIRDRSHSRPRRLANNRPQRRLLDAARGLLPVVLQHLIAGLGDLGTMLL